VWTRRSAIRTVVAAAALVLVGGVLQLTADGALEVAGTIASVLGAVGGIVGAIGWSFVNARGD
jgi:hypothetical protein